jgi:hypothetical protein
MKRAVFTIVMCLCAAPALAQDTATGNQSTSETKDTATTVATAKAKDAASFKLPPGFYEKKHGKHMLYCKKDAPMGTRIKNERCLNDVQMREYLLVLEQQKADLDRIRATCSTGSACSHQ